ncbi:erythromycin esterase family protein [Sphingomonas piscis]|uniref:Erythromycin esterase family protein n=1 Tax=Sphingomonas piscis TaxID=2714943 RepID=A0A6G7YMC1_9SPHN|nr:erythromycin esterase family protein [Sphingomonas piscis]QIK77888.1 erythromycin esterase family protein [Sphingomonas piscis]
MTAKWLAALLALSSAQQAHSKQPTTAIADDAAARRWISAAGHRFNPSAVADADLRGIVERLNGAKVIGIGEATHGTHQDQAFKAELIKALVRSGAIDAVAVECNRAAGYGFDRYVVTGEGDPAALIRSPSFFSIWRNDAFAGLLLWLRAWNQTSQKPIRIYGIDVQESGDDADFALKTLARYSPVDADVLRRRLAPILPADGGRAPFLPDWVKNADAATIKRLLDAATGLEHELTSKTANGKNDEQVAEAVYAARAARQGLYAFEFDYAGADQKTIPIEYWGRRDRDMASNLLSRLGSGRAALWAQNSHIVWASPGWEDKGHVTTGVVLRRELKHDYRAVGFTWSRAVVRAVALPRKSPSPARGERVFSDSPARNDRPGDLGSVFSPLTGDGIWLDVSARPRTQALDRWAKRPVYWGLIGWRFDPNDFQTGGDPDLPPGTGYDVIVWHRRMSPARTWPDALPKETDSPQ